MTLSADKLYYDQFLKAGIAVGNVIVLSKKDSLTVFGDFGNYWGDQGKTKVYQNALMQQVSNKGKDTLFLSADTLMSINDTLKKEKKIFAYHKVKIFDKNMQAICDSMVNNMMDSTLIFFKDPVMWNGKSQMRGDTIRVVSKNKKIDRVYFRTKAFIVSQDTIENFNQVRGKNMVAIFDSNKIKKVDVKGNAESIYFALQGDTVTSGMNKVESVDMAVRFKNQKIKNIGFYNKPKALLIPPHEIKDDDIRLRGFKWRIGERPDRQVVIGKNVKRIQKSNINKILETSKPKIK